MMSSESVPPASLLIIHEVDHEAESLVGLIFEGDANEFVIQRACDIVAARKKMAIHDFDVVLMDTALPDVNGVVAVRAICDGWNAQSPALIVLVDQEAEQTLAVAMTECAHSYLIKQECNARSILRALRVAIRQRSDRLLSALQQHPGDSNDALRLLRRSNYALSLLPRDMPPVLADLVSHLSTSGGANEAVLAALSVAVSRLQEDMKVVREDVKETSGEVKELLLQVARMCTNHDSLERTLQARTLTVTQLEATVSGPGTSLVNRLDQLERAHHERQSARATRHQTLRDALVQMVPVVLTWIGAFVTGLVFYLGRGKP